MDSFLEAKTGHNPSWTWRSILEGQKVLEAGLRWRIGSGSKVIIDEHPWLPKREPVHPSMVREDIKGKRVSLLIDPVRKTWKQDLVREVFNEDDAHIILALPLPRGPVEDKLIWNKLIWHYSVDRNYTVKSGYESALMLKRNGQLGRRAVGESSNREQLKKVWNSVWYLPVQGKIKTFIWKALRNIMAVKEVLFKLNLTTDPLCPVCNLKEESIIHLVARCNFAQMVWHISPFRLDMRSISGDSLMEWWECLLERWKGREESMEFWAAVGNIVWGLWKNWNDMVFNETSSRPDTVCQIVARNAADFIKANEEPTQRNGMICEGTNEGVSRWQRPQHGWVKINFDAGIFFFGTTIELH